MCKKLTHQDHLEEEEVVVEVEKVEEEALEVAVPEAQEGTEVVMVHMATSQIGHRPALLHTKAWTNKVQVILISQRSHIGTPSSQRNESEQAKSEGNIHSSSSLVSCSNFKN